MDDKAPSQAEIAARLATILSLIELRRLSGLGKLNSSDEYLSEIQLAVQNLSDALMAGKDRRALLKHAQLISAAVMRYMVDVLLIKE